LLADENVPYRFVTAIGTPLSAEDDLLVEGLEMHLADQEAAGIRNLLVGGTMGAMQLLSDATWRRLVETCLALNRGRFELLIGAGDTSFARTRDRIDFLNGLSDIDGVVVLSPFFLNFTQAELIDYYCALANESRAPLYLYDLPVTTGVSLKVETVCQIAEHRNVVGIKCSGDFSETRRLIDAAGPRLRVIVAQPQFVDILLRAGVREHLDGMFALAPNWISRIGHACAEREWETAAHWQQQLNRVRASLIAAGVWAGFTAIMNARGILGKFAPRPMRMFDAAQREAFLAREEIATLAREQVGTRA
jgi:4-hydroxy-tetrahydrodipicolinate synthase